MTNDWKRFAVALPSLTPHRGLVGQTMQGQRLVGRTAAERPRGTRPLGNL